MASLVGSKGQQVLYLCLIATLLIVCAAFTIGITFAPCHSSLCVEQLNPLQTRIHIGVYYALLTSIGLCMAAKTYLSLVRRFMDTYIWDGVIPVTGKRVSIGGLLLMLWILATTFASCAYWLPAERDWWYHRGAFVSWTPKVLSLVAWTGVTGHWCDIWIGLVMIPVGRNSIIGKAFSLHTSTLLYAHKVLAYGLFLGTLVHGITYYVFVASLVSASATVQNEFVVDNPTVSVTEAAAQGPISYLVLPTGVFAFVLLVAVTITSLPILRRKSFNTFYFVHIILVVIILVFACLHASTNFYFLLPGLLLWVADWVWRLRNSLTNKVEAVVENAGNGWTRVTLPPKRLETASSGEKGTSIMSPAFEISVLSTYYINFPRVSKLQIHPFTAASAGSAETGPVLLFRRGPERKKARRTQKEFTWALAAAAGDIPEVPSSIEVRIEGPYSPAVPELRRSNHLLLIVGGTGITGAISIANWWADNYGSRTDQSRSLRLLWSVRTEDEVHLREIQDLRITMAVFRNMEIAIHVSGHQGRLQPGNELSEFLATRAGPHIDAWVYVSGPDGLLAAAEAACVGQAKRLRHGTRSESNGETNTTIIGFRWYIARWSL
ncbi:hypothetical protein LTR78_006076 [Recurvomyces mirabilis]|uniref:Uncharacterized protein n=1 Tax=Recurvomyces mirabilis TaxID=574656 RepID=A0AAE0WLG5_9PEZI|nr:hypothetical protein LTR78_006076 [Recurvomyces mirabilis]KAK5151918.1 hypothetical protein LTS14_008692 [Recurvomyces mirabilis]